MKKMSGIFLVAISAVGFGAMAIFARLAYAGGSNPTSVLFLRFTLATPVMLAILVWRKTALPRGRTLLGLVLMGGLGYVGQSLAYFFALTLASAGLVALLLYLYPALVTLLAAVVLKERITRVKVAALSLALIGAILTIGLDGSGQPLGIALAIAAPLIYAVYIISGSRLMKSVSAIPASTVIIASAAFVYGAIVAVQGAQFPVTPSGWMAVAGIVLVSTVLAIVAFFAGIERIGPTSASTISTIEPAVTVLLAALVLEEPISPARIAGGVLILSAVILLARSELGAAPQPGKSLALSE